MNDAEALHQIDKYGLRKDENPAELREAAQLWRIAMKKQIPRRVIINLWDKWLECPVCGEVLSDEEGLPLGDNIDIKYCWSCGQAIDFENPVE